MAELSRTLIGDSAAMRGVRGQLAGLTDADAPVLVEGERGAGKATVARALHLLGGRRDRPFVIVDCAAAGDEDLHADLFGAAGGVGRRDGCFASAAGGTLVLREVGAIGAGTRERLLRSLNAGGVDVRLVVTTAHPLSPWLEQLVVATVKVPPLRDRADDVAALCRHLVSIAARRERRRAWEPEAAALDLFRQYAWPRNVRELQNFVDRAYTVSGPDNPLRAALVEPWLRAAAADPVTATVDALAGRPLADIEKQIILTTLQQFRGHRLKTAGALGIGVRTLGIKLKRWRDAGEPVAAPERAVG